MINCMSNAVECKTLFIRGFLYGGFKTAYRCRLLVDVPDILYDGLLVLTRMVFAVLLLW